MDFLKGKAAIVGCFPCLFNWIQCKDILLAVMIMFYVFMEMQPIRLDPCCKNHFEEQF